ncbi:rod shape-determining protein MreC [Brevibacillus fulvus]|uniref:Cell shape-determining protein MreC n=1 Tax=Brevibacillus fulvus TaxID=1125967 RepID=A0A938Y038_9BACL|nr:rod shape-determining protein MreC [Brevibacillus fulvus]MBM7590024.1 rod shape-determining protein MreC [Brevibacillus fulvus]
MSFFGNKRLIVVLIGLVLLISLVGYTSRERANLTWPEMFLKDTVSVLQSIFYRPAQVVSGLFKDIGDAYNVYQENRVLKANLDQLAQVTDELEATKAENQRLRAALDVKNTQSSYQFRVAEVIARNSDNWNNVLTIDKGQKDGIKKDMAVITPKGLIGRVQSVANFSATVELLTNVENSNHVSARILAKQIANGKIVYSYINGVIEEYDPRNRLLIMRKIPWGQKVEQNQSVVTSGMGGVIPENLSIGKVVSVQADDYGLTQTAYIQPNADFNEIDEVMVVERAYTLSPNGDLVPTTQTNNSGTPVTPQTKSVTPANSVPATGGGGQ